MTINKNVLIDYSLLFITIALSGFPYFSTTTLYVPLFAFLAIVFVIRREKVDLSFLLFIETILIITLAQTLVFNFYDIETILGVFLRIINAYLIVKILKLKFLKYYTNILYYLAIISLVIYFPILLYPTLITFYSKLVSFFEILNLTETPLDTIIVYNFRWYLDLYRNSGPFWEPGAFGGYLMLAILFNFFLADNNTKKKSVVLIIAAITTISSTVYFALFFYFILAVGKNNIISRLVFMIGIILLGFFSFTQFDFLGDKIEAQVEVAKNVDPYFENDDTQRFLSIKRDLFDIKGYEIIGRGANNFTRYPYNKENQIRTVGITDLMVRMGLPISLWIFICMYKSIGRIVKYHTSQKRYAVLISFICITILLMSETYFTLIIFWCIPLLHFVYPPIGSYIFRDNRFTK